MAREQSRDERGARVAREMRTHTIDILTNKYTIMPPRKDDSRPPMPSREALEQRITELEETVKKREETISNLNDLIRFLKTGKI